MPLAPAILLCQAKLEVSGSQEGWHEQLGDVAELADALDLGSSSLTGVQVQLLSSLLMWLETYTSCLSEPVAQLVEQRTFNPWVAGSSPAGLTR